MWNFVVEHFKDYIGTGLVFVYYIASVIRMLITEKRREYRILFIYMPAVVLALFFCPPIAKLMQTYADEDTYYRILWILPMTVTIAYTITDLFAKARGKVRIVILALAVVMIVTGGKLIYTDTEYSVAENEYHMPNAVVEICDEIAIPGREIMVAFPTEMLVYVRQYTPLIVMPYGYEELKYVKHFETLHEQIEMDEPDAEILFTEAKNRSCHYIVIAESKKIKGSPEDYGFYDYAHIDGYVIYRSLTADFNV